MQALPLSLKVLICRDPTLKHQKLLEQADTVKLTLKKTQPAKTPSSQANARGYMALASLSRELRVVLLVVTLGQQRKGLSSLITI